MTLVIIANTSMLALDHYHISATLVRITDIVNYVFYSLYVAELLLKVMGLGFKNYFKDRYNTFDFAIVLVSTIDIILTQSNLIQVTGSKAV
jgi:voltage-dependent calcium channel L type alpha-1D